MLAIPEHSLLMLCLTGTAAAAASSEAKDEVAGGGDDDAAAGDDDDGKEEAEAGASLFVPIRPVSFSRTVFHRALDCSGPRGRKGKGKSLKGKWVFGAFARRCPALRSAVLCFRRVCRIFLRFKKYLNTEKRTLVQS